MPIYDYQCSECGYEFEKLKKISERHWNQPCPNCNSKNQTVSLVIKSPLIVSEVGDIINKASDGFKDNLNRIKKHHPRNTIKT